LPSTQGESAYPCAIFPVTARTLPGDASQIATADNTLTTIQAAKATV
jgi:hypothetical protein